MTIYTVTLRDTNTKSFKTMNWVAYSEQEVRNELLECLPDNFVLVGVSAGVY